MFNSLFSGFFNRQEAELEARLPQTINVFRASRNGPEFHQDMSTRQSYMFSQRKASAGIGGPPRFGIWATP